MAMRWLMVFALLVLPLPPVAAGGATVSIGQVMPSALNVRESVDQAGIGALSATIQGGAGAGAGLGTVGQQNVDAARFVRAPAFDVPARFTSEAAAIDAVRAGVEPAIAAITAAMRPVMIERRLAYGFYQYLRSVQVTIRGRDETRAVVGTLAVGADGSLRNLGWRISPGTQYVLYVVYEQQRVAQGLPSGWARGNAGDVRWQLYEYDGSRQLTASGAITTVATNGLYDAPQPADGVEADPDAGLNRLISEQVQPLLASEQASYAIVDYGRTVEPVYEDLPNGDSVAQVAVQVDERRFTGDTCGLTAPTFAEQGQIGWLLNRVVDRYLVMPADAGGVVTGLGRFQESSLSPTQSFSKSVSLATGAQAASYTNLLINPFPDNDLVYDWHADTVNGLPANRYVSVAGLTVVNTQNSVAMWCGTVPGVGQVVADTASGSLTVNGQAVGWGNWRYRYVRMPSGTYVNDMVVPGFQPAGGDLITVDTEYEGDPDNPFMAGYLFTDQPQYRAVRFSASAPARFRYVGGGYGFAFNAEFYTNSFNDYQPAGLVSNGADYAIMPGNTSVVASAYRDHNHFGGGGWLDTYVTGWQSQPRARLYRVNVSGNTNTYTPAD